MKITRLNEILGWTGTAAIIIATCIRATGYSNLLDLVFTDLGCFLWSIAAYRNRNNALLTVNAFSVLIVTAGILKNFF